MLVSIIHAISELRRMYPPAPSQPFGKAILGLVVGTLVLAVLFYMLERLFPERTGQPLIRTGTKVDAIYWFFDFFVSQRLAAAASIIVLITAVALGMPRLNILALQPLWLQAMEAMLVAEFCAYWSHRMLHEIPILWRLHKVHHTSECLDWLASARFHPLESVWNKLVALVPLFLLGFSPKITVFFGPLLAIYPIFLHSNVRWGYGWLGYVVASPAFHRWHHSADREALDKNYGGLLPLFDFLFGTAHFPKRKPVSYGLADDHAPAGFWQQLLWPFKRSREIEPLTVRGFVKSVSIDRSL
jgi:sterol desaturase/sphingolipid hydroxylase (fatty acid hydroxylase superfamily)